MEQASLRSAVAVAVSNALESHAITLLTAARTSPAGGMNGTATWLDHLCEGMAPIHWCITKKCGRLLDEIIRFRAPPATATAVAAADDDDDKPKKKTGKKEEKGKKGKKARDDNADDNEEKKDAPAAPAVPVVLSPTPNLNVRNHKGKTALHMAIDDGEWELIQKLVEQGVPAGVQLQTTDNQGETVYHAAVRLAITSASCMTATYDAADVWPRVLKLLAANGAPVNAVNTNGQTALHIAYSSTALLQSSLTDRTQWSLMKLLIELGGDITQRDTNGLTAPELIDSVKRDVQQRNAAAEEKARLDREGKDQARERKRNERADRDRERDTLLVAKITTELREWLQQHSIDNDQVTLALAKHNVFNITHLRALSRADLSSIDSSCGAHGALVDAVAKVEQADYRQILDGEVLKFLTEHGLDASLGPLLVTRKLTYAQLPHLTSSRIANWFEGESLAGDRQRLESALDTLRGTLRAAKIAEKKDEESKKSEERLRQRRGGDNTNSNSSDNSSSGSERKTKLSSRRRNITNNDNNDNNNDNDDDNDNDDNDNDNGDVDATDNNRSSSTTNSAVAKPATNQTMMILLLIILLVIAWLLFSSA